MTAIPLSPTRQAEPERFGQSAADALDEANASYLELHSQHFHEDLAAAEEAIVDLEAGPAFL